MSSELLAVLIQIEQERGIPKEKIITAIEKGLISASKKSCIHPAEELEVKIDPKTGKVQAWAQLEVAEKLPNKNQIILARAQEKFPDVKVGDIVKWEVTPRDFGRIAAQTARQIIAQAIRDAEKEEIKNEYEEKLNDIVSGYITRMEKGNIIVDMGNNVEAIIKRNDKPRSDKSVVGDHITAYLKEINTRNSPCLHLSRSCDEFVKKLFEQEVAEVRDGVVEIVAIAREPGERTKLSVRSNESNVEPVGACIGIRGTRITHVIDSLNGEKIDIIPWSDNIEQFVKSSLKPAELKSVVIKEDDEVIEIYTTKDQAPLLYGKRGVNIRLASKLIQTVDGYENFRLEVIEEEYKLNLDMNETEDDSFAQKVAEAKSELSSTLDIDSEIAEKLVINGFTSLAELSDASEDDLMEIDGIDNETAVKIIDKVLEM